MQVRQRYWCGLLGLFYIILLFMKLILLLVNFSRNIGAVYVSLMFVTYFLAYAQYRHECGTLVLVLGGHE
jgi:hypothetical protein